jgi:hypothetical protein
MLKLKPLAAMLLATTALSAAPTDAQELVDSTNFRNAVTLQNIRAHQRAL